MHQDFGRKLIDYLRAQREDMVAMLERLVRAESPSDVAESQRAAQAILGESLLKRGFCVRLLPGCRSGGMLYARPENRPHGRRFQLLLGHCDTVWPVGTLESMPPKIEESRFRGPGSYDMKAGLVQALFAFDAMEAVFPTPPAVTPVMLINSDEEIGSRESTHRIRWMARYADRVFVLEPSVGLSGKLKTARKGIGRFTIRVFGKAAHAGLDPHEGASAILELSNVVQKLFALNDHQCGITVNVGMIDGGLQPNVVAPESTAVADVRVLTHADARAIEDTIHALEASTPGTRLEIDGKIGRPPMEKTPGNRQLWQLALEAADDLQIRLGEATAGGGSDGNTTSLYAPTLDGLGAVGAGAHSENEFLFVDKMIERAALLARLMAYPPLNIRSGGVESASTEDTSKMQSS